MPCRSGAEALSQLAQKIAQDSKGSALQDDGSEDTQPESDSEDEFLPADADPTSVKVEEAGMRFFHCFTKCFSQSWL